MDSYLRERWHQRALLWLSSPRGRGVHRGQRLRPITESIRSPTSLQSDLQQRTQIDIDTHTRTHALTHTDRYCRHTDRQTHTHASTDVCAHSHIHTFTHTDARTHTAGAPTVVLPHQTEYAALTLTPAAYSLLPGNTALSELLCKNGLRLPLLLASALRSLARSLRPGS